MSYVPLESDVKAYLAEHMGNTINSVLRGWFLTALAQGVLAIAGYLIAGVPSAILLGVLTSVAGLIPSIGTALVWGPVGLLLLSQGSIGMGIFLLIYGFFVISLVDNVLRPMLVGSHADLPFLYLVFALLGGFELWGLKGIILGPLLITIAPIVLEAFNKSRSSLKETSSTEGH
jgi:predicted PurR-regulated permease PerM